MTMKECVGIAARVWCKPSCAKIEMDGDLAYAFAETLFEEVNRNKSGQSKAVELVKELASAVEWCSGSADFGVDGKARKGWERICIKALDRAGRFMMARGVK